MAATAFIRESCVFIEKFIIVVISVSNTRVSEEPFKNNPINSARAAVGTLWNVGVQVLCVIAALQGLRKAPGKSA